jgi:uncharacterized protein (UPF0333 family)
MLVLENNIISMVQIDNCIKAIESGNNLNKFDEGIKVISRACINLREKAPNGFIKFELGDNPKLYNPKNSQKGLRTIFLSSSGTFETDTTSLRIAFTDKQPKLINGLLKGISFNSEKRRVKDIIIVDVKKDLDLAFFYYFVCPETKVSNPSSYYNIANDEVAKQNSDVLAKIAIKITNAISQYHTGDNYAPFVAIFKRTFGVELPIASEVQGSMMALTEITDAVKAKEATKLRNLYIAIEEYNSKENVKLIKEYSSKVLDLINSNRFTVEGGLSYIDNKPFGVVTATSIGKPNLIAEEVAINIIENNSIKKRFEELAEVKKAAEKAKAKELSEDEEYEDGKLSYAAKYGIATKLGIVTKRVSAEVLDAILKKEIEVTTMIPEGMSLDEAISTYLDKS